MATDQSPDYRLGYSHGVEATQQEYEGRLDQAYRDGKDAGTEESDDKSYNEGYADGQRAGWDDIGGSPSLLVEVFALDNSLFIKRGGEFDVIDTRTGDRIGTRLRVPEGARRVNYAG